MMIANKSRQRSNVKLELQELDSLKNPHKRGNRFEGFCARLLECEEFNVSRNSKSAKPRQTDLLARRDQTYFLVEAKWLRKAAALEHISAVRDRLRRVPNDVFACVFSMSGYSKGAVDEACRERSLEIILFDGHEIRGIAAGDMSFSELLAEKRAALRTDATVWFQQWPETDRYEAQIRSRSDEFRTGDETKTWLRCKSGGSDAVFSNETLDFAGRYERAVVSLNLGLDLATTWDLEEVIEELSKHIPLKNEGCFSIHQRDESWLGFGIDHFLSAVRNQDSRYDELRWDSYHHSEDITYVDKIEDGGLLCLTCRQSTAAGGGLDASRMELLIPGIPVDTTGVRAVCKFTGNPEANFENVGRNPVKQLRLSESIGVEPVSAIISKSDGREYVSGLVIKNPFVGKPLPPGEPATLGDPFWLLSKNEYLCCSLRSWHNPGAFMSDYRLRFVEGCWIEHVPVFYALCDWT